ncbi:hypothetical protein BH11BAC6_BH11BAC6_03790 [soil metagenome]
MKIFCRTCILALVYFIIPATMHAEIPADTAYISVSSLFEDDSVLEITLSGNIRELLNDRSDDAKYHDLTIAYIDKDSNEIIIPAEAKTRGHFRRLKENCFYPPLLINFSTSDTLQHSIFKDQHKLKLVMPCQDDEYVIHEWLVYKLYNLVTPQSFRARLVHVKFADAKNKKPALPFYAIMLEEEKQMAKRNGLVSVNRQLKPEQTVPDAFIKMAVFEYLIGNTDWSVQYMQNIKLIAADSNAVATTVAYDFDHAGIVDAPYAQPAEELLMSSVRERRYRGYCMQDMKKIDSTIALFNSLKPNIYSLYSNCALLDEKYKKATIKYLDDFYAIINNPVKMQKEFAYPCDKNGTGNVVIKGLKEE